MEQQEIDQIRYEMRYGKPHGVECNLAMHVQLEDMRDWKPETVAAFMGGVAKVIAVGNEAREIGE